VAHKVQRNEPCPCGSGKKYKNCCMQKQRERSAERARNREAIQMALGWLSRQYRQEIDQWVEDVWLADVSAEERHGIATADPRIRSIHDINLLELLIAEGAFAGMEGENRPLQLILSSGDLSLDDGQRAYLGQLEHRPLHLYRVESCKPGESFALAAYPADGSAAVTIEDKWASRMFEPGDTVGLRLMPEEGGWETSGAIYHIPDEYVDDLCSNLAKLDAKEYSRALTHYWLGLVAAHA